MSVFALALLVVILTFSDGNAAKCGGATRCKCGDKVTKNYVMTADLGPCKSHGLRLGNGVTLDGNGHVIRGLADGSEVYGVYLRGTKDGTVRNVVVTGFLRGIRLRKAHRNQILNNETFQNGNFAAAVGYGIDVVLGSSYNTFQGNLIHDNADEGIHFGASTRSNIFIGNSVYNNFRENIYVLSSDENTFTNNVTWGGQNSLYLKDSRANVLTGNAFRDATAVIRAEAHDNVLIDNDFVDTGLHIQVYTQETPFRYPHDNTVIGGTVTGAAQCVRFSSSWNNVIIDTVLTACGVDILSDGDKAESQNTFIGVVFNPSNLQLDTNSSIHVGWHLNVHVQDENALPLSNARVRVFDGSGASLLDVLTDSSGNIATQDVIEYTQTAAVQSFYTPIVLETTKAGYQADVRQIPFTGNTAVTVTLQ